MDRKELLEKWKMDEKAAFSGWDFSYLDGRWESDELPWSYDALVRRYLKPESSILDMDTGGGEYLLSLNHPYDKTSVTEAWEPNVRLCREKLAPLGIRVEKCAAEQEALPFPDESFDMLLNRHGGFLTDELYRVLKPGGMLVTQQVGGLNNNALSKKLIHGFVPKYPGMMTLIIRDKLIASGFDIIGYGEFFPRLNFFDTGAIAYFAKVIEWEFPDFSVDGSAEALFEIEAEIQKKGYFESREHRMFFIAQKPLAKLNSSVL